MERTSAVNGQVVTATGPNGAQPPAMRHSTGLNQLNAANESSRRASFAVEQRMLRQLLHRLGRLPIEIELWDGTLLRVSESASHRLRIRNRGILWRLARNPLLWFGEGYSDGSLEVEGDFVDFLRMTVGATAGPGVSLRRRSGAFARRRARSLAFAQRNIHHHYDIGNQFYKLWLDEQMLYTCAYYRDPAMSLEHAQAAKMDHVCRKLQLRPGETVIEAGCGWGGFALHMARQYGVTVRAYNISKEQIAHAREVARSQDLDDRVEFVEDDWRNITGRCDVFVSIGMLEHVGIDNFRQLGDVISACLHPGGRGLIHSIGRNYPAPLNPWIVRNIFPGAEPPALSQAMDIFESRNFSVLDVENIRLHYAVTCRDWLQRFEDHVDEIRGEFDERFVRMWRMYLASSMVAFECGSLQLFQILFAPGRSNAVPWTRDYIYRDDAPAERGSVWRRLQQDSGS